MSNPFRQKPIVDGAQDAVANPICDVSYGTPAARFGIGVVPSHRGRGVLPAEVPHVANYLEEALDELLAFTNALASVWKKDWPNNPAERLNREIW